MLKRIEFGCGFGKDISNAVELKRCLNELYDILTSHAELHGYPDITDISNQFKPEHRETVYGIMREALDGEYGNKPYISEQRDVRPDIRVAPGTANHFPGTETDPEIVPFGSWGFSRELREQTWCIECQAINPSQTDPGNELDRRMRIFKELINPVLNHPVDTRRIDIVDSYIVRAGFDKNNVRRDDYWMRFSKFLNTVFVQNHKLSPMRMFCGGRAINSQGRTLEWDTCKDAISSCLSDLGIGLFELVLFENEILKRQAHDRWITINGKTLLVSTGFDHIYSPGQYDGDIYLSRSDKSRFSERINDLLLDRFRMNRRIYTWNSDTRKLVSKD